MRVTDPKATYSYIAEEDRKLPQEEQTFFMLRRLTRREYADLEDGLIEYRDSGVSTVRTGTKMIKALKAGLRGWSNLRNGNGQEVSFKAESTGEPSDETLDYLSQDISRELMFQILSGSRLSPEQIKN